MEKKIKKTIKPTKPKSTSTKKRVSAQPRRNTALLAETEIIATTPTTETTLTEPNSSIMETTSPEPKNEIIDLMETSSFEDQKEKNELMDELFTKVPSKAKSSVIKKPTIKNEKILGIIENTQISLNEVPPEKSPTKKIHIMETILSLLLLAFVIAFLQYFHYTPSKSNYSSDSASSATKSTDMASVPKVPVESITIKDTSEVLNSKPVTTDQSKPTKAPESFNTFTYDAQQGKRIVISGVCHADYYALLIFKSQDDYRKNVTGSLINKAYQCPTSSKFKLDFDLRDFNLISGHYYLFVADQGKTGSWYNPR